MNLGVRALHWPIHSKYDRSAVVRRLHEQCSVFAVSDEFDACTRQLVKVQQRVKDRPQTFSEGFAWALWQHVCAMNNLLEQSDGSPLGGMTERVGCLDGRIDTEIQLLDAAERIPWMLGLHRQCNAQQTTTKAVAESSRKRGERARCPE